MKNKSESFNIIADSSAKTFVIAVSARTLFDLEESNAYFEKHGQKAYEEYEKLNEDVILKQGPAFNLIKKLFNINEKLPPGYPKFEVVLVSRNSVQTASRIIKSIEHYNLDIVRAIFTDGQPTADYVKALETELFLSSNPTSVKEIIDAGLPAALITGSFKEINKNDDKLHIAFDGDSVLFGDSAEKTFGDGGLIGFQEHEYKNQDVPLEPGPFKSFLDLIHNIQVAFGNLGDKSPIKTALITARSMPAHLRAIKTLQSWGVKIDSGMFLGGRNKTPFLKCFNADIFFDDSKNNIELAKDSVLSAHVLFGVRNSPDADDSKFSGGKAVKEKNKNKM